MGITFHPEWERNLLELMNTRSSIHRFFDIRVLADSPVTPKDLEDLDRFSLLSGQKRYDWYPSSIDWQMISLFNNKRKWIEFMKAIALESYVPKLFTDSSAEFPCILKLSNKHFGRGVFVIRDVAQLRKIKSTLRPRAQYHLEEALTGMDLSELTAFGSVAAGELLSLRCLTRVHIDRQGNPDGIFIKGSDLTATQSAYYSPCGLELVTIIERMFESAPTYTGAYAAHDAIKEWKKRPIWYYRFKQIWEVERQLVETGGIPGLAHLIASYQLESRYDNYWGDSFLFHMRFSNLSSWKIYRLREVF